MDLLKHMGERFKELRENKGYTTRQLARFCGVSQATIHKIERGKYFPPYGLYEDMFYALGSTFSEFMSVYKWSYTEPKQNKMEVIFNDDYKKVS